MPLFRVHLSAANHYEIHAATEDDAVYVAFDLAAVDGPMWDVDEVAPVQDEGDDPDVEQYS